MNFKRTLGLDILNEKYAYATDEVTGYTSAQKIPDRWVSTTCGYCSVGCGMFVGVKDDSAVSVRGNPNHRANFGTLCPKGLSEHYTLESENWARYPLLRKNGVRVRVNWDEALSTMADKLRKVQEKYGPDAIGVLSTGQLVTEEFYALGKLVQLGFSSGGAPLERDFLSDDTTVVVYMPGTDYGDLALKFRAAGFDSHTCCLVVSCATTERELIHSSTLEKLEATPGLPTPAILIVGGVARHYSGRETTCKGRTAGS